MNEKKPQVNFSTLIQLSSAVLIAVYVLGFIVVTSYLVKNGIYSVSVLNPQYLAAGLIFSVASIIFYFLVARNIYFMDRHFREFSSLGSNFRYPGVWCAFCFIYVLVGVIFRGVVGALLTANLLFNNVQSSRLLLVLLAVFVSLDYMIEWGRNLYENYSFVVLPAIFLGFITIIFSAIISVHDARVHLLYFLYIVGAISFYLNSLYGILKDKGYPFYSFLDCNCFARCCGSFWEPYLW